MKKKLSSIILSALLVTTTLIGCGSSDTGSNSGSTASTPATTQETTVVDDSAPSNDIVDGGTVTIAASPTPHAEILEFASDLLAEKGYTLEVTEFSDYVLPNNVVDSGEIDANYFQGAPYLESFNEEQGTNIVAVGEIHYEPFGIYAGTETDLTNVPDGATIAIPNDTTNEARALLLLQDNGLITLADDIGLTATILDIEENPYNLEIVEMEAAQIARVREEMAFVALNGNYALQAGLSVGQDAVAYESSDSIASQTYVNIVCVNAGNENNAGVLALVDVLKSDEVVNFINETYDGSVIPYLN